MLRFISALAGTGLMLTMFYPAAAQESRSWEEIGGAARGQTVYFNAWAGDPQTNAFIARIGDLASKRYGVTVEQVKLKDTAEAVTRVVAEKAAARDSSGTVDLIWINGPNFLTMKNQGLLFGPFAESLPNWRYVDTDGKPSNLVDFTVPVDGYAVPWRMAQVVFLHDVARTPRSTLPKSVPALLGWAKANPGRLTHPTVRDFLGATFSSRRSMS
jgi:putative thiamine transport system substrate-binding protein